LKRYKEISLLLWKYGRSDLAEAMAIDDDAPGGGATTAPASGSASPEQLADDLEAMGPTYVKLGQVLSSRPDLLPEPDLKGLARLQDNVKPFAYADVEAIVSADLGVRISKAFSRFDEQPIAAASLGQVHAAALPDGRRVVVKVQRPGVAAQIADDFEVLEQIAEFAEQHTDVGRRYRVLGMLEEFRIALRHELDYEREARNLIAVGENLLRVLLAVSDGKGDEAADVLVSIGEKTDDFDVNAFRKGIGRIVVRIQDTGLRQINVGAMLLRIQRLASDSGLFVPSELTLLGKTLLQLDEIGNILDPTFDPNAAIRRHAADIMSQGLERDATHGSVLASLLEMKHFVAALPSRVNRVMDTIADAELEMKVRVVDADQIVEGFQKVANRIASGIVLAALIIGAALLMRIETPFHILGYPGLAMLCFIAAAAGGCWLLVTIFAQDRKRASRPSARKR
jgi:predicted unusual protein kinase regulating ubiquinone biosynthesis (AarF/ABC1/UbiB family)